MADFRQLAIDLVAADGKVDREEISVLKASLYADNRISASEVEFLADLRAAVAKKGKKKSTSAMDKFFLRALEDHILKDNVVTTAEVTLIEKHVLSDKKLAKGAKKLAKNLKKKAQTVAPELDALLESLGGKKKKKK
jgi:hypothetical protein